MYIIEDADTKMAWTENGSLVLYADVYMPCANVYHSRHVHAYHNINLHACVQTYTHMYPGPLTGTFSLTMFYDVIADI